MTVTYVCTRCSWAGRQPDFTDTSVPLSDAAPMPTHHLPICPKCGENVDVEVATD